MIQLPDKIRQDTSESYLNIHPLIVIGWDSQFKKPKNENIIISSTKEEIIWSGDPDGRDPIYDKDLKISTLKESIDFETRKFKINNLNLSFSNFNNFSSRLADFDVMNEVVAVLWKTQSCIDLNDCLLVYEGQIVRYDHDEKIIKIDLEDKSLFKIDKDVPIANLGTSSRVYNDKYVNKYIPMAYGHIPRAPAIIYALNDDELSHYEFDGNPFTGYYVIGDDVFDSLSLDRNITGKITEPDGLLINKGNYWHVASNFPEASESQYFNFEFDFPVTREQCRMYPEYDWNTPNSYAYFVPDCKLDINVAYPGNPIANNTVFCWRHHYPNQVNLRQNSVTEDYTLANPQYIIDKGFSDIEAQTFGLNPEKSFSSFPDADRDSWNVDEISPYDPYDASEDLSDTLGLSRFGNFLDFEEDLVWLYPKIAGPHNWHFGTFYYWGFDITEIWASKLPPMPFIYEEIEQGSISDEDWWSKYKKWKIHVHNYANWEVGEPFYGTPIPVFGGIHEGSWCTDYDHYTWNCYGEEGESSQVGSGNKRSRPEYSPHYDWNNGSYNDVDAIKLLPRCWDLRNYQHVLDPTQLYVYAGANSPEGGGLPPQYEDLYGQGSYPDSWSDFENMLGEDGALRSRSCLMQIPSTNVIRQELENYLSEEGITVGSNDPDNPPTRYTFTTYLDGLMYVRDSYNDNESFAHNIDAAMSSESSSDVMEALPDYPLMLQILAARPYGQLAWIFGYDIQQVPGTTAIYNRYPTKFIVVTMDGSFDIEKWNWKDSFDDGYYSSMQTVTHVIALWDLIDFRQFTIGSIYDSAPDIGGWGFGYGGSNVPNATGHMHGGEQRHSLTVQANLHTNNVLMNNPDLGEPGGEHNQYIDSTKLGGGLLRWHMLATRNDWASQTGLQAGVLHSQYNNYEEFYDDQVQGQTESWGVDNPDGQWPQMGQYQFMIPESPGFATMDVTSNDNAYMFVDMKLPDVGADDILDDGFRAYMKFNFKLGLDIPMMTSNQEAGLSYDSMNLSWLFFATNGEASGQDVNGQYSQGYTDYSQAMTALMSGNASYLKEIAENDLEGNGQIEFNNITMGEEDFPLFFQNSQDNDDNSTLYSEFSAVGRYGSSLYIGETWDPWYNPGQYNNISFAVHYRNTTSSDPSLVPLGFNFQFKQMFLEYTGIFEKFTDSPFYINNYQGRHFTNIDGIGYQLIQNPADVIHDILRNELFYDGIFNNQEYNNAVQHTADWNLGFSVTEKTNAKKLIEDLCIGTPIYPRFRSRNEFGFITVKNSYWGHDVDRTIKSKDVIKYKFTRSKIEKLATSIEVKFDYDYETQEYRQTTGWFSCKDYLGDGDLGYKDENGNPGYSLGYYNLGEDRSVANGIDYRQDNDTARTLEARYITSMESARKYGVFYCMYNCNQHILMTLELTLAYLNLEVGDIIEFDELIGNVYAYGLDYTQFNMVNGQEVFPYFMVQSVTKKLDKVEITCIQMHKLLKTFTANKGDISRKGSDVENPDNQPGDLDKFMLVEYLENKQTTRYTASQIKSMDINYSNSVTYKDLAFWDEWIEVGDDPNDDDSLPPEPPGPDPADPGAIT